MELAFLLKLCLAHVAGDFLLQPDSWVRQRRERHFKSPLLYLHAAVQAVLAAIILPDRKYWWMPLLIGAGHILFDGAKAYWKKAGIGAFVLDQLLHLALIIFCWWIADSPDLWTRFVTYTEDDSALTITLAYALVILLYPRLIAVATAKWRSDISVSREKLVAAGRWIGIMERMLVLTFILINQWAAIGFLLGAKSILRIGDLREPADKSQTEYILIGTLLSFSLTIGTGLAVMWLIR